MVGRVYLYAGMTSITEAHFLYDAKPLLCTVPAEGTGGGGDVATDTIWNAAGDLAVGTGANTATILSIGADGDVLTVDTDTPAWSTPVDIASDAADIAAINLTEGTRPTAPGTGHRLIYAKSDGVYQEDSGGTETKLASGTGGGGHALLLDYNLASDVTQALTNGSWVEYSLTRPSPWVEILP